MQLTKEGGLAIDWDSLIFGTLMVFVDSILVLGVISP